jgi:hypothetical protein
VTIEVVSTTETSVSLYQTTRRTDNGVTAPVKRRSVSTRLHGGLIVEALNISETSVTLYRTKCRRDDRGTKHH